MKLSLREILIIIVVMVNALFIVFAFDDPIFIGIEIGFFMLSCYGIGLYLKKL